MPFFSDPAFILDSRLASSAAPVGDLAMCRVLLNEDARFPWLILVPRQNGLIDLTDLGAADLNALMGEVRLCAEVLKSIVPFAKLNVASLGNAVPQLHVHVIGRDPGDAAWPGPVWGLPGGSGYPDDTRAAMLAALRRELGVAA